MVRAATASIPLRENVICPHCWHRFPTFDVNWISVHMSLLGDTKLGKDQPQRFLPTRFDARGNALDACGVPCEELACPNCHLVLPRACLELAPLFVSIVGTPSSGKSYFLASMIWQLRRAFSQKFHLALTDAAPAFNHILTEYEEKLFLNSNMHAPIKLEKTEETGDRYDAVAFGDQTLLLPRPFLYGVLPADEHPNAGKMRQVAKLLHLYDNAGESFQPGKDTALTPMTRHLQYAKLILFCYDPTQDGRFRKLCDSRSQDWQIRAPKVTFRQDIVLSEMAARIRRHVGLHQNQKHQARLVVVVTKYDAWRNVVPELELDNVTFPVANGRIHAVSYHRVDAVSRTVRELLFQVCPEMVVAAESLCRNKPDLIAARAYCRRTLDNLPDLEIIRKRLREQEQTWNSAYPRDHFRWVGWVAPGSRQGAQVLLQRDAELPPDGQLFVVQAPVADGKVGMLAVSRVAPGQCGQGIPADAGHLGRPVFVKDRRTP